MLSVSNRSLIVELLSKIIFATGQILDELTILKDLRVEKSTGFKSSLLSKI
jgi:hypothetical protein